MGITGELRYDRYNYIWLYNNEWVPVIDRTTNTQVLLSSLDTVNVVILPFSPEEDPSTESPSIASTLARIEKKIDKLLGSDIK